jgi:hypothetical protein
MCRAAVYESCIYLYLIVSGTQLVALLEYSCRNANVNESAAGVVAARSAAARLLRLWVRIPPGTWMSVCCECCGLSGRGLCDGPITRSEEFYRLWCVVVCDLETSGKRGAGQLEAVAPKTNESDECKESKECDTWWSYGHCFLNIFLILGVICCGCGQDCYCKMKHLDRWQTVR